MPAFREFLKSIRLVKAFPQAVEFLSIHYEQNGNPGGIPPPDLEPIDAV